MAPKRQMTLLTAAVLAVAGLVAVRSVATFIAPQPTTQLSKARIQLPAVQSAEVAATEKSPAAVMASMATSAAFALAAEPAFASYDGEAYRYDDRAGLATGWLFGLIFAGVAITGGFVYVFTRPGMFDDAKE
eukprot:TRINITY_DN9416_c0_g1_i1.p1 TRINITY_DN9416_c0_g1~~TRINITY_DN9416_c0_g1_i1.p1  ORF type:complete len:132 (-),score=38.42 TRINITY_DN9416_c0_g1_i1:160-555(-)